MDAPENPAAQRAPFGLSLGVVQHAYLDAADAVFGDLPGGARGYQVLAACSHQAPPTQAACAHQLGIDRTVFTYLVDDLERDQLVERQADPNDRRARRIAITARGRRVLKDLDRRLKTAERHALRGLTAEEQEALNELLWRAAAATAPAHRPQAPSARSEAPGAAEPIEPPEKPPAGRLHVPDE